MKPFAAVSSPGSTDAAAAYARLLRLAEEIPVEGLPSFFAELERARWTARLRIEAAVRDGAGKHAPRPLLTAEEVAETLRVSMAQVYRMAKGPLRSAVVVVGEGTLRFEGDRIARFLESRRRA